MTCKHPVPLSERLRFLDHYHDRFPEGGRPFGAAKNDEVAEIRAMLQALGETDEMALFFNSERIYTKRPSLREKQDSWEAFGIIVKSKSVSLDFTDEEKEYLVWLLDGVNNPLGASIFTKLTSSKK